MEGSQLHSQGKLYIVGIGPGGAGHMTGRAVAAISESEYVLGNSTYMQQVKHLLGGKKAMPSGMGDEVERAKRAVGLASSHIVSLVSGGDANVYGMAGIVFEVAAGIDVDIEVVPGVTALSAASALLGAPLVTDFAVISLSDLLTPWEKIVKRLECAASSDFVIAIYNPKSRGRSTHFAGAVEIIRKYRAGTVPVGIVKNATRDGETAIVTTLDRVLEHSDVVDMSTTIIIGNSESMMHGSRIVTPRGYRNKYEY
ncbi:MAG TPA: precorrin-3B C(17)-methyltransferase [Candidatus Methanoperedenaceae archaeon]|nr:precorrin-3B C(17)-methyltransferase [Candidatus Methanoperedenaceae archaeon]